MSSDHHSSARMFFGPEDFPGAEVTFNAMEADFDVRQEEFSRDLLQAYYPNGCLLDLDWTGFASCEPRFQIRLVQTPERAFEPFAYFPCATMDDLRTLIPSCAALAKARPSIARPLSREWRLYSPFHEPPVDRLMLDPLRPLSEQTNALHAQLFVGLLGDYRVITIGWEPPHQFPGEFIIRRYQDDPDCWDLNANDPDGYPCSSWQLTHEWRCKDIASIRSMVEAAYCL